MRDPEWRRKLVEEYDSGKGPTLGGGTEEETTPGAGDGMTTMIIEEAFAEHLRKFEGMNMGEIAKARGQHVVECLLDVALEDNLKTQFKSTPSPHPCSRSRTSPRAPSPFLDSVMVVRMQSS